MMGPRVGKGARPWGTSSRALVRTEHCASILVSVVLRSVLALLTASCALALACSSGSAESTTGCGECWGTCIDGKCVCPAWYDLCGATCVNRETDPANCGACGESCGDGFCVNGLCEADCKFTTCPGKRCVDLKASNTDCGGCGVMCAAGTSCKDGACAAPPKEPQPPTCTGGKTVCGTECVDLGGNPAHCGYCTRACPASAVACKAGDCVCPDGIKWCVTANICVNLDGSLLNCGSCGHACTGANPRCCGGACKDIAWDEQHCGSCANACPSGKVCCKGGCVLKGTCK